MSSSNDWSNARVKEEVKDDEEGSSQVFVKPEPFDEYETNVSVKREVEEIDPLSNPDRNPQGLVKPEPVDEYETSVLVPQFVVKREVNDEAGSCSDEAVKIEPAETTEFDAESEILANQNRDVVEVIPPQYVIKRETIEKAGSSSSGPLEPLLNPDRNPQGLVKPEPVDEYETSVLVPQFVVKREVNDEAGSCSDEAVKIEPAETTEFDAESEILANQNRDVVEVIPPQYVIKRETIEKAGNSSSGPLEPLLNPDRNSQELVKPEPVEYETNVLAPQFVVKREVNDEAGSCSDEAVKIEPAETTEDTAHFTLEQEAGIKKEKLDSPGRELVVPMFEEDEMPSSSEKAPSKKPIQKTTPSQDDEIDNKQLASPSICGKTSRKASKQALGRSGKAYHSMTRRSMTTQSTRDEHEMTDEEPQMMTRSQKRKWLDDASKKKEEEEK